MDPSSIANFGSITVPIPAYAYDPSFVATYDVNGNILSATGLSSGGDDLNGITVDKHCNVYLGGDYTNYNFVVGSTTLTPVLSQGSCENLFLAKLTFTCAADVGIETFNENKNITVFPNPNNGSFNLNISNAVPNSEIVLTNSLGRKIHDQKIYQGQNNIATFNLAAGIYYYTILTNKQQIGQGKLSIEK